MAKGYLDRFDELQVVSDEENYHVRQDWIESAPLLVVKMKAIGFTKEHLKTMITDPIAVLDKMNNKMTMT